MRRVVTCSPNQIVVLTIVSGNGAVHATDSFLVREY